MNTNLKNNISSQIEQFSKIPLAKTKDVRLMRRIDTKYVCNVNQLLEILDQIKYSYHVVDIDGLLIQNYETIYFDTPDHYLYKIHHNGIKNRHKIRFRKYIDSELSFFEIKRKTNRKETVKTRKKHTEEGYSLEGNYLNMLDKTVDYDRDTLSQSLTNKFSRITLVNKNVPERVTIDFNLNYKNVRLNKNGELKKICIIELKRDLETKSNFFPRILKNNRIYPIGFSKYCMGLMLSDPSLKRNLFKKRLLKYNHLLN